MPDHIAVTGLVATTPRHIVTSEGLAITSFRLASNQRRYDRNKGAWVDADTNWYTVTSFRQLAVNTAESIHKGDRIVVSGQLKIRDWESGDRSGTTVEIEAHAVGHDLTFGVSSFVRNQTAAEKNGEGAAEAEPAETFLPADDQAQLAWAG